MEQTLEDMRNQWQQLNQRVESLAAANTTLTALLSARHLEQRTRMLSLRLMLGVLSTVVVLLLTGGFIGNHAGDISLLVFPAALHVMLVAHLANQIWFMVFMRRMSWQRPVVAVQRDLLRLRRSSSRMSFAWLVFWLVMHVPLLFWVFELTSGYDIYADPQGLVSDAWVISQWVVVVVLGLFVYWVLRYHRDHPWVVAMIRESAGRGLGALERDLAELDAFQRKAG